MLDGVGEPRDMAAGNNSFCLGVYDCRRWYLCHIVIGELQDRQVVHDRVQWRDIEEKVGFGNGKSLRCYIGSACGWKKRRKGNNSLKEASQALVWIVVFGRSFA